MEEQIKTSKRLAAVSRFVSGLFTPFMVPFAAFLILFLFTYLRLMPIQYKLVVLGIVYCFTVLMPVGIIFIYGRISGWTLRQLSEQKKRIVPYLLTIISYVFCVIMMYRLNIPPYMIGVIVASLVVMIVFVLTNFKWKFSAHLGGMGVVVGCIVSFSAIFGYNPVWWLCLAILGTGVVGSARIVLEEHTLSEVLSGFTIGLVATLVVLHPTFRFLFLY